MFSTVLCYAILSYDVLCCCYFAMLRYFVLCCAALCVAVQSCGAFCCVVLYHAPLWYRLISLVSRASKLTGHNIRLQLLTFVMSSASRWTAHPYFSALESLRFKSFFLQHFHVSSSNQLLSRTFLVASQASMRAQPYEMHGILT